MERLTNHFDYCKMIDCKFYDAELRKENKCKFFDLNIEHCHEKRMNDKLREYEDLEEQVRRVLKNHVTMKDFVESCVLWFKLQNSEPELADAIMLTNEDAKQYREWKDLEEQGLLLRLPCKVGDTVYFVDRKYDRKNNQFVPFVHNGYVKTIKFSLRPTKVTIEYEDIDDRCGRCKGKDIHVSNIGKTVFLTRAEAEKALAEMEK